MTSPKLALASNLKLLPVLLAGAISLSAQSTDADGQDVVKLDRYVVTGSNLDTPVEYTAVKVITANNLSGGGVSTNLLDALRKEVPAFTGNGNLGLSNGVTNYASTYGGSKLSLHNMATLVLVDGRRVSTNGANARGGSNFVDVSQIPMSAVERVEVLTEGASAIYGSDALGGVVNIILKKNYNGGEVGGRYALSTADGHYAEKSAWFSAGASNKRLSMLVAAEFRESDPLMQSDRAFGSTSSVNNYSGVVGSLYLNPDYNSPSENNRTGTAATATNMDALVANGTYIRGTAPVNLAPYVTMLVQQNHRSAFSSLDFKIFDKRLQAFADVLFSKNTSVSQLGAQAPTSLLTVPANTPYNPTRGSVSSVNFRYLPVPRQIHDVAELTRFTVGLRGEINSSWNWETSFTGNQDRLTVKTSGVLYSPNLDLAILGGYDQNGNAVAGGSYSRVYKDFDAPAVPSSVTSSGRTAWLASHRTVDTTVVQPALDPFASSSGIDKDSLANVLGVSRADFTSNLDVWNAVVRGEIPVLPAGPIGVALGGDYRTEKLKGVPDANSMNTGDSAQRWVGATFFDRFSRSRNITSGYSEVRVPVTSPKWNIDVLHTLILSAAYRVEHYSDAGDSRAPKYTAVWQPMDEQVTVHASWAKGFAAPPLYSLYGGVTQSYTTNISSYLGLDTATTRQATILSGSNSDLRPTTTKTRSFGVDFRPKYVKGLHLGFEYTDTAMTDYVGTVGPLTILQSVEQLGTDSPYVNQVALNAAPGSSDARAITAPHQLSSFIRGGGVPGAIFVSDTKRNLVAAKVRTLDATADYTREFSGLGQFTVGTTGTFFIDDKIKSLPSESYYEYAGLATSYEGTMPPYRFYSTLEWKKFPWEIVIGNSYIPSVTDCGTGGSTFESSTSLRRIKVASYMTWDVAASYTLPLAKTGLLWANATVNLKLGVNNVGDRMPPIASQAFAGPTYPYADVSTYNPIGRLYYVSTVLKF